MFVLGTDEAGYGPNLGPLCIAASAWELPEPAAAGSLYDRLANCVTCDPAGEGGKLPIADSKILYKPGGTLAALERGVLTMLALLDRQPRAWRDIWRFLDPKATEQIDALPWHEAYDEPLPTCLTAEELSAALLAAFSGLTAARVKIVDLQSSVIFPAAFNTAVDMCDNKAEVLSLTTLRLARRMLESLPDGRAVVFCDKHGGRMRYAGLLQHIFPDKLVTVRRETAALAIYEIQLGSRGVEFRFQPKGERHLPTALASMTAKYLRELAMRPFNAFWQRQVPGLRPTAGYPSDSRRFYDDIRLVRERLHVADAALWRAR
jgi:hypothetical protein